MKHPCSERMDLKPESMHAFILSKVGAATSVSGLLARLSVWLLTMTMLLVASGAFFVACVINILAIYEIVWLLTGGR